jgi:hypothetical protein
MQEDNVMVEFNIPPASDEYMFSNYINHALEQLDAHIYNISDGRLERDIRASRLFSHELLANPQAMTFGCSPDFNAYAGGAAFAPVAPALLAEPEGAWRFSGGHVHIGYRDYLDYKLPEFVVAHFLDLFLGGGMLSFEREQGKRAELYGLPGRYRPTEYGLEYRSLSNMWIHDPQLVERVGSLTTNALNYLKEATEAQVSEVYGQMPWPSLHAALRAYNTEQLREIRTFIASTFRRNPIARFL